MTLIIGGKHDLSFRNRQLHAAMCRAKKPLISDEGYIEGLARRAALFYQQFDEIPILVKRRTVAHTNGTYVAKLIRRLKHGGILGTILHYVKAYEARTSFLPKCYRRYPPCLPLGFMKTLENYAAEGDRRAAAEALAPTSLP